ncbi:hypothetical protein G6O69_33365 [Pseudenhygromyxa sp. WMMC2535]|uniref:hypothetical protein n=1 Tax=Pseudenhygromyxa sp. WMMC2535 TaxID=2712867 RepID=UPI001553B70E|nr:hypothetical protein [Pseudenhygromyxa sp. WMMC2535]NVB42759.1 hypothetical protein [Pseudenhygromyxa sp. WMMC2535]
MDAATEQGVKCFEIYRRDNGRTGISRRLHHDPATGRSWVLEVHEKSGARGDSLRVETEIDLEDMEPEERMRYELRLTAELAAERAARPLF